jgi:hypothetical protein
MSKEYRKEVNRWKLKSFFLGVLKREGKKIVSTEAHREELAEILTTKLIEKLKKETK